jgi:hypothetical protein
VATAAVEFEEGLVVNALKEHEAVARKRSDLSLATKTLLAQVRAAAERQLKLVDLLVSAHANGEFEVCESITYPITSGETFGWERMDKLRKAMKEEKAAWGKDGAL